MLWPTKLQPEISMEASSRKSAREPASKFTARSPSISSSWDIDYSRSSHTKTCCDGPRQSNEGRSTCGTSSHSFAKLTCFKAHLDKPWDPQTLDLYGLIMFCPYPTGSNNSQENYWIRYDQVVSFAMPVAGPWQRELLFDLWWTLHLWLQEWPVSMEGEAGTIEPSWPIDTHVYNVNQCHFGIFIRKFVVFGCILRFVRPHPISTCFALSSAVFCPFICSASSTSTSAVGRTRTDFWNPAKVSCWCETQVEWSSSCHIPRGGHNFPRLRCSRSI